MHPRKCHLLRYSTWRHFSPLHSSIDLLIQNSPDSYTQSQHNIIYFFREYHSEEEEVQVKKQKIRIIFSDSALCTHEKFQRQKYLSLQQMQELSNILNLS